MNAIVNVNSTTPATMTSLEIVELINNERQTIEEITGKVQKTLLHKNFLLKTKEVLGEDTSAKFLAHVKIEVGNGAERLTPIYIFPKREATLMAMSYSPAISAAVYDRMTALEDHIKQTSNVVLPNFSNPPEAARAWAIEYERSEQLALVVQQKETLLIEQAPKVTFHDKVVDSSNCQTVEEVAKVLGMGRNTLFKWLRDNDILRFNNLPYQRHISEGHFKVIEKVWENPVNFEVKVSTQTLVTGKGLVYIQKRLFA